MYHFIRFTSLLNKETGSISKFLNGKEIQIHIDLSFIFAFILYLKDKIKILVKHQQLTFLRKLLTVFNH